MERRVVRFNGYDIHVIHDDGTDRVALKPIIEALGLKWTNEYQRAKDNFDTFACIVPIASGKLGSTLGINYGELETYLHSFKNRSAGFKPPDGFWKLLQECINYLPHEIFITSPAYNTPEPSEEVLAEKLYKAHEQEKLVGSMEETTEAEQQEMSPHPAETLDFEKETDVPDAETETGEESEPEIIEQENEIHEDEVPPQEPSEPEKPEEPQSYTAFIVDDKFKGNIDDVIETLELFTETLSNFKDDLLRLRNSQFVLLDNKTKK